MKSWGSISWLFWVLGFDTLAFFVFGGICKVDARFCLFGVFWRLVDATAGLGWEDFCFCVCACVFSMWIVVCGPWNMYFLFGISRLDTGAIRIPMYKWTFLVESGR